MAGQYVCQGADNDILFESIYIHHGGRTCKNGNKTKSVTPVLTLIGRFTKAPLALAILFELPLVDPKALPKELAKFPVKCTDVEISLKSRV
jgi:hypothetical protein